MLYELEDDYEIMTTNQNYNREREQMKSSSIITKIAALGLSALLITGCAGTAGTNFAQVAGEDSLALGRTTSEQLTANLGKPMREGTITKNGQVIKTASYAYANTHGHAIAEGVIPTRSQAFYFTNDKLVGYDFTSSWKSDSTNFNTANVAQIKKGISTRNDVVQLLGKPPGKYAFPMIAGNDGEEAMVYAYTQTSGSVGSLKTFMKKLVITLNKQGVVTDVDLVESGQR
jgi:hypothetical protein